MNEYIFEAYSSYEFMIMYPNKFSYFSIRIKKKVDQCDQLFFDNSHINKKKNHNLSLIYYL